MELGLRQIQDLLLPGVQLWLVVIVKQSHLYIHGSIVVLLGGHFLLQVFHIELGVPLSRMGFLFKRNNVIDVLPSRDVVSSLQVLVLLLYDHCSQVFLILLFLLELLDAATSDALDDLQFLDAVLLFLILELVVTLEASVGSEISQFFDVFDFWHRLVDHVQLQGVVQNVKLHQQVNILLNLSQVLFPLEWRYLQTLDHVFKVLLLEHGDVIQLLPLALVLTRVILSSEWTHEQLPSPELVALQVI